MNLLAKRLLSYLPQSVPVGMTAHKKWSLEIAELVGPIAGPKDIEFAVAAEVIRLDSTTHRVSKNYFVRKIKSGAAKQIAGAVLERLKNEQKEQIEKEKQAAATAVLADVANGQKES